MVKRVVGAGLSLALVLTMIPLAAFAEEGAGAAAQEGAGAEQGEQAAEDTQAEETVADLELDVDTPAAPVVAMLADSLPARSAILIDQGSGQVLYEQNPDEQLPPASVTKIMTLLLVMEALESGKINLDDVVTCSENANSMGGSQIWFKVGEQMSVNDLLKAVAIASANDASVALGEHVAGSEEAFVNLMNQRGAELGMTNTTFLNCTGLDETGHQTTARDIALMSRELMKHPRITEYSTVWMDSLRDGATELVNTNKLVRFYEGCTGLKTGTTSGAGSCLSATATRDGLSLVAVVMGSPTSNDRFAATRGLLDHGFANYMSVAPPSIEQQLAPVKVLKGTQEFVTPVYIDPGTFVVDKNNPDALTQEVALAEDVEAPVEQGQVLGKVEVLLDGSVVGSYDLTAAESVDRMTFGRALMALLREMLRMRGASAAVGGAPAPGPAASGGTGQSAAQRESAAQSEAEKEPCVCGKDTCYCADIGNVCGCLTE